MTTETLTILINTLKNNTNKYTKKQTKNISDTKFL